MKELCQPMLTNDPTNLQSEIKKINSIKSVPATKIDGFQGNESISSSFARKYKSLLSSVESNTKVMVELISSINRQIESTQYDCECNHIQMFQNKT